MIHQEYIDMLRLDVPSENASKFTPVFPCSMNPEHHDENGRQKPIESRIYVDNDLLVAPWK
jgi:hypothetical protein